MKILLIPTVREIYKNQFEYCFDFRFVKFIKSIFKNSFIEIYTGQEIKNYSLIVFLGGNNSILKNKADILRNKLNNLVYNYAIKERIKILGVCHGAHFLARKNGYKLKRRPNHTKNHKVIFFINKKRYIKTVNSYHNETIEYKKRDKINAFGKANDNTVEAYHIKSKKILGIMWHPERYEQFKKFDKHLLKKFYAINSIVSR